MYQVVRCGPKTDFAIHSISSPVISPEKSFATSDTPSWHVDVDSLLAHLDEFTDEALTIHEALQTDRPVAGSIKQFQIFIDKVLDHAVSHEWITQYDGDLRKMMFQSL